MIFGSAALVHIIRRRDYLITKFKGGSFSLNQLDKKLEKLSEKNIESVKKQIIDRKAGELLDIFSNNY